jgi:transcriptional regulator with XRE-family HTH domain
MDRGITQKAVAQRIGTDQWSVINWERNRTRPALRFIPQILELLGYDPRLEPVTLGDQIRARREAVGMSRRRLAQELGVDDSMVLRWERGLRVPPGQMAGRLDHLLGREQERRQCE